MAITAQILGGAVQLTGIPAWVKVSGGVAPAGASEYKYLMQVISVDGKLLVAPEPDAIAPDENGEVMFNIAGVVNQPVKAVFQYPPAGAAVAYPTQAFNIQVKPGESYIDTNGTLIETWGAASATFQMLKGGVSQRQISMWTASGSNFYQAYIAAGKWLTHRPWGDFVHPAQPVKLWFMPAADAPGASFRVKYYFSDGTDAAYTAEVNLDADNLYEFNCNPAHLGVNLTPTGKRVEYFDVAIDGISDSRRFHFDWRFCERPMFVLFANSIGGVDDVYLSGRMIDKFSVEGNTISKPAQRDNTIYDPVLIVPDSLGQNRWVINSGHKSATQMLHLRDMFVSRQKWLLYPNSAVSAYTVIPVTTEPGETQLIDRSADLYHIDIAITEAEQSQFSFDNRQF
jgi:hypothetical protein